MTSPAQPPEVAPPAGSSVAEPPSSPPGEKTPSNPLASLTFLIVDAGLLVGFISAVVFVAGWSYADRYFAELGLNLSAIDGLAASSFSTYALWVFGDAWLVVATFLAAAGFAWALVVGVRKSPVDRRLEASILIGILAALVLIGAGYLGADRARRQVPTLFTEHYQSLPRIAVTPTKDSMLATMFAGDDNLLQSTCLRRVFMDHRNIYTYAGYESLRENTGQDILILPLSEIAMIKVISNTGLCP